MMLKSLLSNKRKGDGQASFPTQQLFILGILLS